MASRWTPKSGKLPSIYDRREGKRMSVKVGKEPQAEDMCPPRKFTDGNFGTGRPLSTPRLYTPEQQYNYKSKYARYLKALDLKPSGIQIEGKCEVYYFHSCDAPSRAWTVKVCPQSGTFIEAGNPITIICPPDDGYQLVQVESDGETFTWTQLSGTRTIVVEPPSAKNPRLFVQNTCSTDGCDDASYFPIVLQVTMDGSPELFDYLTVYTTPTDTHYGIGAAVNINLPDAAPCRQVNNIYLVPIYTSKAYVNTGDDELVITWSNPTCSLQYLTGTSITKNVTGEYVVLDIFGKDEEKIFAVQPNVSYRIGSQFNAHGRKSASLGKPFRFNFSNRKFVLGDETVTGISATAKVRFARTNYTTKTITSVDNHYGISATARNDYSRIILKGRKVIVEDTHHGLACVGRNRFTRVDYGGVIIG